MELMKNLPDKSIDLTLTDIPYDHVNRDSNGLRKLDKGKADIITFNIDNFLNELYRITKGTIIIFCGINQLSQIYSWFSEKQKAHKGTVRHLVWQKTNPSPMNGQYIYLSGIEDAIWFKNKGSVFNARCKNTVFKHPCGRSKLHPTEKNHNLIKELILDNSNENQILFDPCMGSGTHGLVALNTNRKFIGFELDKEYFEIAKKRIEDRSKELEEIIKVGNEK
ncbi:DNA-methyltransferase [Faecalibacillus intestinalis]|uniref:DNA-methyltransferase n=1 Tax=Faecalibacillus intestinalis TaxID=1982626 RepID=UPI003522945D